MRTCEERGNGHQWGKWQRVMQTMLRECKRCHETEVKER